MFSVDVQLAAIGLINKIMDTFVQASLKHTASIFLTKWMAAGSSRHRGASLLDLDLKSELTQPWTCIYNFHKRRKLHGWKALGPAGIFRFIVSLWISCCVILLALAINTVGIPKERWYPNLTDSGFQVTDSVRQLLTITTPIMQLHGLDWDDSWNQAWDMVGPGPASWDAAAALVTTNTYTTLAGISNAYRGKHPGWNHVTIATDGGFTTGINTFIGDGTVQSISVQHFRVREVFEYFRANGSHAFQRNSMGWIAQLNVTVPRLTTTCCMLPAHRNISDNTIAVCVLKLKLCFFSSHIIDLTLQQIGGAQDDTTLDISIGSVQYLNFTGVSCQMALQQVLFPVGTWLSTQVNAGRVDLSLNDFGSRWAAIPIPLNASKYDHSCAESLRDQLRSTLNRIDRLLDTGIVHHMALTSRRLAELNDGFSNTTSPDAASMAPVLAVLAQHLLTIASWNMTASPDPEATVESFPVRWQVYGSGPRLAWEWAAVVILVVVLLVLLLGGLSGLTSGLKPGSWLETAGMMLLANKSNTMESVKGSIGGQMSQKAAEAKYYLQESRSSGRSSLVLVDNLEDSQLNQNTTDVSQTRVYEGWK